jgi:hypothetical protein
MADSLCSAVIVTFENWEICTLSLFFDDPGLKRIPPGLQFF